MIDIDLSCDNEEVVGPRRDAEGTQRIWQDVLVELRRSDGDLRVAYLDEPDEPITEDTSVRVEILSCERGCVRPGVTSHVLEPKDSIYEDHRYQVADGRYVFRFSRSTDEPGRIRFRP